MRTVELQRKYGSRIKHRHKLALNRLTKVVNSPQQGSDMLQWRSWTHVSALSPDERVVRNPQLFTELRYTTGTYHDSQDLDGYACKALTMLRRWHEAHGDAESPALREIRVCQPGRRLCKDYQLIELVTRPSPQPSMRSQHKCAR